MHVPNVCTRRITLVCLVVALTSMGVKSADAQMLSKAAREKQAKEREREGQEAERYKGISVETDPKATGDDHALQKRIADLLSVMDIVPRERTECFQWMSKSPYTKITGWYGSISNVTSDPKGKIVTLVVRPRTACDGAFWTSSHTIERYLFANGELGFLGLVYQGGVTTWN